MHHPVVKAANACKRVLVLIDSTTATVTPTDLTTGEVLIQHLIDPDKNY